MSPEPALRFAAHLLAVAVSLGAALVVVRDPAWRAAARGPAALGFLAMAAGEALLGAGLAQQVDPLGHVLRIGGYGLVGAALGAAWLGGRPRGRFVLAVAVAVLLTSEAVRLFVPEPWAADAALATGALGYVGVAAFALRAVRASLPSRFAAALVALVVVAATVASSAMAYVLAGNVRAQALDRVEGQADAAAAALEPIVAVEARKLVVVASGDQAVRRFRRELRFGRAEMRGLRELLFPDVDFILFLSDRGRLLGREGISAAQAFEVVAAGTVAGFTLRTGQEAASLDVLGADRMVLVGAAPVRERDRVLGAAVAGHFVDDPLLTRVTGTGFWAAAFRRARPIPVAWAGFETEPGTAVVDPAALQPVWEGFLSGEDASRRTLTVAGTETYAALAPLRRSDGEPVGMLMVAEPAGPVAVTQGELNRLLFLATVVLILLAFGLAALVARRITRPVISLTRASRQVAAGDLETKADVRGEDEVGELAAAFNHMTESLGLMTSRLRASAEEEARLRNRLETVVDSMGDGLVAVDADGRVTAYNQAAAAILGRPRTRVAGRPLASVLEVRDPEGASLPLDADLPPGLAFVLRPDGREVPVAIVSSPLRGGEGAVVGRVLVLRDMSREHEVERMKSEFLANVSHELRTPLTPIIGYAEILSAKEVTGDRARQFAGAILSSAQRLERVVAMLLDFAAMEGGRMTVAQEPASLRPLVQKALEEWRVRAGGHRFVARYESRLPDALADVSLIKRALDEVLDNAVKYSPDGGTIMVSVSSENSRWQQALRLEVRDEGIGIDPEHLPRIFDDFRQVDASDTRSFGGLGLGLAFVKRIVEAHRGTISASSVPGAGTTFSLVLPAADSRE